MQLIGNKKILKFNYIYIFLILALIEIKQFTFGLINYPPFINYTLTYLILFGLFIHSIQNSWELYIPNKGKKIFLVYWLYSILVIIVGIYKSTSYWDYKYIFVDYIPFIFLSFSIFIGINFDKNKYILDFFVKKLFPIILIATIFFFDNNTALVSRLSIPLLFFILSFNYINNKSRILIIIISIIVLYIDFNFRTNSLRIFLCYFLLLLFYILNYRINLINIISFLMIISPIIFIVSGINGTFDIFIFVSEKINLYYPNELYGYGSNTRTFIYSDVFKSIQENNSSILFGDGASAGYQTLFFTDQILSDKGRLATEVGFLTTLLKSGIFGVLLNFLILIYPAHIAINHSKNKLSKLLGFYLIINWVLFFVEVLQTISVTNFINYIIIGFCLSNKFRNLSDLEVKQFFNLNEKHSNNNYLS